MEEYFPEKNGVDYNKLQMANNSSYSITKPTDAKQISVFIDKFVNKKNLVIMDGTANVGGDVINFGLNGNVEKVIAVEYNKTTYEKLVNNVKVYGLEKKVVTLHGDTVKLVERCMGKVKIDILFLDAPWGGRGYKREKFMDLEMGGKRVFELVRKVGECGNVSNVILKVPFNYNLYNLIHNNEFKHIVIEKIKTSRGYYLIILIKIL